MSDKAPDRVAAIDCGTNSLRLLVADVYPGSRKLVDVVRRMEIVRLGQGVDATGRLAPEALERTFAMLTDYAKIIADSGASAVRMVATSATRDASNAAEFTVGVRRILGIEPEVVTGAREAYLSFYGATAELADGSTPDSAAPASSPVRLVPPYLVADIGGGSTEFVLGTPGAAADVPDLAAISVDIGCVRLTERYLTDDPPSPAQLAAAKAAIDAALDAVAEAVQVERARSLVGLAGSVTTVTAMALGLSVYDPGRTHLAQVTAGRVREVTALLLGQSRVQRALSPVIHPGRVDVIGAGALILDRIIGKFGFTTLVASEHDILDGIAWSAADRRLAARQT